MNAAQQRRLARLEAAVGIGGYHGPTFVLDSLADENALRARLGYPEQKEEVRALYAAYRPPPDVVYTFTPPPDEGTPEHEAWIASLPPKRPTFRQAVEAMVERGEVVVTEACRERWKPAPSVYGRFVPPDDDED
jgi:hypothetical protein